MKKLLIPAILIVVLALGGYFAFFVDEEPDNGSEGENTEQVDGDGEDEQPEDLPPSPEELEKQQRLMEHARPQEFIDLRYDSRKNVLGESIIEGSLENNAELTTYKDLQLMIYFVDGENTPLDSASQVVFETLPPSEKVTFRLKEKGPRKTDVRLDLIDANVVEQ